MREYSEGAYFVSRKSRRAAPRRRRGAGVLVFVLILLTAGICLLVVFLPRLSVGGATTDASFSGKTFYFLTVGEYEAYAEAELAAKDAMLRGSAGYIYNDGKYKIVAAVYERESDAAALASINDNAKYFAVALPSSKLSSGDGSALKALVGDWFSSVYTAATELDRGNASESAAERAVVSACRKLSAFVGACESGEVKRAIETAAGFSDIAEERPQRSTLSCIRYLSVKGILTAAEALGANV